MQFEVRGTDPLPFFKLLHINTTNSKSAVLHTRDSEETNVRTDQTWSVLFIHPLEIPKLNMTYTCE